MNESEIKMNDLFLCDVARLSGPRIPKQLANVALVCLVMLLPALRLLFLESQEGSMAFSHLFSKSSLLYPADRYLCLEGKHVVILGDSQMNQVALRLSKLLGNCTIVKTGSRCGEVSGYLELGNISSSDFVHPGRSEGPVAYGLQNLGSDCRDCNICEAKLFECKDGLHRMKVEYIAVEFARDVSLQSSLYRTTQENVGHYLSKQNVSHVIFNAGLHDSGLEDASGKSYRENLIWYSGVLRSFMPLASFLWVDTVPVVSTRQPNIWRNVTANWLLSEYNRIALRVTDQFGYQRISPFGILQLPYFSKLNSDGVHYLEEGGVFYDMLAFTILLELCK